MGIALYGVLSDAASTVRRLPLRPALALRARVASVRQLKPGQGAGYGLAFVAQRPTRLACVTIGYADGVPRDFALRGGQVLIGGQRAQAVGRVCMDQMLVDVTEVKEVRPGSVVTLIERTAARRCAPKNLPLCAALSRTRPSHAFRRAWHMCGRTEAVKSGPPAQLGNSYITKAKGQAPGKAGACVSPEGPYCRQASQKALNSLPPAPPAPPLASGVLPAACCIFSVLDTIPLRPELTAETLYSPRHSRGLPFRESRPKADTGHGRGKCPWPVCTAGSGGEKNPYKIHISVLYCRLG